MQSYDILMLVVLGAAIVWGAWKGLAWQIASLASIALSYFVALNFREPLARIINASPPWNVFSAMLILFLGTGLVVWIGFNLVSELIERVKLKEFDRQLGALFGAAKGVVLCVLITLFAVTLLGDDQRQAICNSKSGYYIAMLLDRADAVMPKELHDVLGPYIHELDHNLNPNLRQPPTAAWQVPESLKAMFGGPDPAAATPPPAGEGPANDLFSAPLTGQPSAARRIEAKPAEKSDGSFRLW